MGKGKKDEIYTYTMDLYVVGRTVVLYYSIPPIFRSHDS